MGLYQRLQGKADTLIRKYGKLRLVTHSDSGAYDPDTGKNKSTNKSYMVPIVVFPYEIKFVNDTTIKHTDLWGMFSAVALPDVPQPGDKLDVDGVVFTFGAVKPMNPGGVAVYYEAHLTRG